MVDRSHELLAEFVRVHLEAVREYPLRIGTADTGSVDRQMFDAEHWVLTDLGEPPPPDWHDVIVCVSATMPAEPDWSALVGSLRRGGVIVVVGSAEASEDAAAAGQIARERLLVAAGADVVDSFVDRSSERDAGILVARRPPVQRLDGAAPSALSGVRRGALGARLDAMQPDPDEHVGEPVDHKRRVRTLAAAFAGERGRTVYGRLRRR